MRKETFNNELKEVSLNIKAKVTPYQSLISFTTRLSISLSISALHTVKEKALTFTITRSKVVVRELNYNNNEDGGINYSIPLIINL